MDKQLEQLLKIIGTFKGEMPPCFKDEDYDCRGMVCNECYTPFADHLLANGVIAPPCKLGDTVYFISEYTHTVISGKVDNIRIQHPSITVHTVANAHLWADEVFLTLEEAEQALAAQKEREDESNETKTD